MSDSLKVFITGASSGIGAALAAHYARQGAVLGLCARRLQATQTLLARLRCAGACYQTDVTDAGSVQTAAADFMERFGVPDIVIANAGVSAGTLTEISEDLSAFRRIMDTNVFGMAATFHPFVAPMRASRRARACRVPAASTSPAFDPLTKGGRAPFAARWRTTGRTTSAAGGEARTKRAPSATG